ncbi:MAG: hypothetical protein AMXMBFR7_44820 [Planctomycetota bacterium]
MRETSDLRVVAKEGMGGSYGKQGILWRIGILPRAFGVLRGGAKNEVISYLGLVVGGAGCDGSADAARFAGSGLRTTELSQSGEMRTAAAIR